MSIRELISVELRCVFGGATGGGSSPSMTENECIGAFTLGGAALGFFTAGGAAGAGLGAALGGGVGMVLCSGLTTHRYRSVQQ